MNNTTTNPKHTILIVDDTPDILKFVGGLLDDEYRVKVATSGESALRIACSSTPPDLILLDVEMPAMDGYEVCRRLKADAQSVDIPVIFLTAHRDSADEREGLSLGAVDFIGKPINGPVLMARVKNHLTLREARRMLQNQNAYLEQEVDRRVKEVNAIQDLTIRVLASLAETRDNETGNHIRRTQLYVQALAAQLSQHSRFSDVLDQEAIKLLYKSAPLHDIGKVGIPDRILLKPGKLTPEEFEVMKTHTTLGHDALARADDEHGMLTPFLRFAREIAYSHQEKWDGSGYPLGLAGDAIPVSARLMAVADVYDALVSRRVYKGAYSHETSMKIMREGRGTHFDPDVLDAFLALEDKFHRIAEQFSDAVASV